MGTHSVPTSTPVRAGRLVTGAVIVTAGVGLLVGGTAGAAPKEGRAAGHLVLTVGEDVILAGPGKALRLAVAECEDLGQDVDETVTVDTVRAAFPNPVEVCDGVTLASQVAADEDEA